VKTSHFRIGAALTLGPSQSGHGSAGNEGLVEGGSGGRCVRFWQGWGGMASLLDFGESDPTYVGGYGVGGARTAGPRVVWG
jgi:hypothetical protein